MTNVSLVYLCGGISSRFGGEIKQFAVVGPKGETLIEYSINQALSALSLEQNIRIENIIFIVSDKTKDKFKEFFSGDIYRGINIKYAYQEFDRETRDRPWGTADAFSSLKGVVTNPFIICNGDDIYGEEAFSLCYHFLGQNNLSLNSDFNKNASVSYKLKFLLPENDNDTVNRGVFTLEGDYISGIKELLNISRSTLNNESLEWDSSVNFMCLAPNVVDLVFAKNNEFKEKHKGNRQIEHFLPEVLSDLIREGKIKMKCIKSSQKMMGITRPQDLEYVRKNIALEGIFVRN